MIAPSRLPSVAHIGGLLASAALVAGGPLLAIFGVASWTDAESHAPDRVWGAFAMATAALALAGAIGGLVGFARKRRDSLRFAVLALGCALAGCLATCAAGASVVSQAQARGGDWGAAATFGGLVFCVLYPGWLAALAAGGLGCALFLARSKP